MVKDTQIMRRNPLHGLLCPIRSKVSFIFTIPHETAFVIPVVEHWLDVSTMRDQYVDPLNHEQTIDHRASLRAQRDEEIHKERDNVRKCLVTR